MFRLFILLRRKMLNVHHHHRANIQFITQSRMIDKNLCMLKFFSAFMWFLFVILRIIWIFFWMMRGSDGKGGQGEVEGFFEDNFETMMEAELFTNVKCGNWGILSYRHSKFNVFLLSNFMFFNFSALILFLFKCQ